MIPAGRQRNYLQSALYVMIAGVLAAVLLERLLTYAEAAEKAAMEATLSRLQAALYFQAAYLALKGEHEAVQALGSRSPFGVADVKSPNYLGEFEGVPAGGTEGKWVFDRQSRELVYVPNLKRHLRPGPGGRKPDQLRFRVEIRKEPNNPHARVLISPIDGARWDPVP